MKRKKGGESVGKVLTCVMICMQAIIGFAYLFQGNIRLALYFLFAGALNACVIN